jgi:hypothetical protein
MVNDDYSLTRPNGIDSERDSAPASPGGPRERYARRLLALQSEQARAERRHRTLGRWKLIFAALALVLFGLALGLRSVSMLLVLVPVVVIVLLEILHERVEKDMQLRSRAVGFYERGMARLDNRWMGTGETGEQFEDAAHPYARDLDVFGKGSLFELLSTARTRAGEEKLAEWLLSPAAPDIVRSRQEAIDELRERLDLREDLAVIGEDVRSGVHSQELAAWGEGAPLLESRLPPIVAPILAATWLLSLVVWAVWDAATPAVLMTLIDLCFSAPYRRRAQRVAGEVEQAGHDLDLLAQVLERLEREQFRSPRLAGLRAALETRGRPPSRWIAKLGRLVDLLESRRHLLVATVDPFVFWTLQLAFAVEKWRRISGPAIRRWLDAVGEMEALLALAGYAFEHPADVFPEFVADGPCFDAEGLAHPFLPERTVVRNDVRLDADLCLLIISGSNMAGKSTLVRAVGTNSILAQCGAPVRARRLRISPLAVGASIGTLDSLLEGASHFYAEIRRLKQILDMTAEPLPVLFLLDEFLQGTNSYDRRIGAEATVRSLVGRGAVGLVTTHDLALANIADSLAPRAANVHFDSHLEDGKLLFNYRLQPGRVERSNALDLMRSIGLDV